jgi:feruloyl esterase
LTATQVDAARKLYAGPADPQGRRLYPGEQTRGSELAWAGLITPSPLLDGPLAPLMADGYLKHMGYPIGAPHSSLRDFQFTEAEFHRLTPEGVKGNAMSLDLSEFRRSGGKLIIWQGWADQAVPPSGTLDYYDRLTRRSGGPRETQRWARVFMIPAMQHCEKGYRLNHFDDPLPQIVDWVEHGIAPDQVVATQVDGNGATVRSRPVFPYPLRAKYDGTGSIDDARNFVPAPPLTPPRDTIAWTGSYLHDVPGH